jgi:hypothetical protein
MTLIPQKSQYQRKKSSAAHTVGLCADLSQPSPHLHGHTQKDPFVERNI